MWESVQTRDGYALVSIMDDSIGELPREPVSPVAATETCLLASIRHPQDGYATIVLTDEAEALPRHLTRRYRGTLPTPSRTLSIEQVVEEPLFEATVRSDRVLVEVWTDHEDAPEVMALLVRTEDERPVIESIAKQGTKPTQPFQRTDDPEVTAEALTNLNNPDERIAVEGLVQVVATVDDFYVVEKAILDCLDAAGATVRAMAVTCIGNAVRAHRRLSANLLRALERACASEDPDVRRRAEYALGDFELFVRRRCSTLTMFRFEDGALNGPASGDAIAELRRAVPRLPSDYLDYLAVHDGGEGEVPATCLFLLRVAELIPYQRDTRIEEFSPGFFVFGTNGGGETFAFDLRANPPHVVMMPAIGGSEDAIKQAATFSDFLLGIAWGTLPTFA
ncbi:MAG TPA: SMI1/KNR4 family protein [Kofleriaceae bacterium]|jgi:hypothetical protein